MKQIIVIMIAVMFCFAIAGPASAETTVGTNNCTMVSTIFGGGTYASSTGVTVNIKSIPMGYCAAAQYQSSNDTNGGLQSMPPTTATPFINGKPTHCTSETAV